MKNINEMDQTYEMIEKNMMNEKNKMNEKQMMSGQNSECELIRVIENAGMNVMYSYNGNDRMSEINGRYDVIDLTPVREMKEMNQMKMTSYIYSLDEEFRLDSGDERLDLHDLHTSTDHMEPINVSRKVTHRRGRKAGKRAGRVSVLLGAFAMVLGLTMAAPSAGAQKLEQGVRGEHVLQLQEQLSELGYFKAGLTGYYGSITKGAVRKFQQAQGLSADGIAGPATLNRLNKKAAAQGNTLRQLAKLIHGEARGESFEGQVAVGAVVLNRVHSNAFPSSIPKVIFQKGQFTAIDDGQFNTKPTQTSYQAARKALNGTDPTHGALYYYNPKIATSLWSKSRPTLLTIGQHDFTR
ncbi:cell wall hydrolase [Paenibacillus taichungensis]|uniref:cell wall hydrolase n=1 Tax=Paenibacillus taichungensis TaxID=484184 RepID=UPI002871E9EF|nr:cell wall hydrolase [Paenibacillus taichungensis]MDR9746972.1 cell wall hydrolase [Paenibacillus taichungensis]MEC0108166.1 cell wall hydrolase [Paenibacillus taichungensis]MEC0199788.1 cell wall hydrolase [Paenibacillus taichungensis]